MKNDFIAPVVKTLFIPEGNPGIKEIQDIRVSPNIRNAVGDASELTITGEMDIELLYLPVSAAEVNLPWRGIDFDQNNATEGNNLEQDEETLIRLEESLMKKDADLQEKEWELTLQVPFTIAIDTDTIDKDGASRMEPVVQNVNWVLINPKALEFEAILQLLGKEIEVTRQTEPEEEIPIVSEEEPQRSSEESKEVPELCEETAEIEEQAEPAERAAVNEQKPVQETVQETVQEKVQAEPIQEKESEPKEQEKLIIRQEEQIEKSVETPVPVSKPPQIKQSYRDEHRIIFPSGGFYQMRFYRVQGGEDLDAISYKLGVAKETIKAVNGVSEEEIKTGLLLSIPKQ